MRRSPSMEKAIPILQTFDESNQSTESQIYTTDSFQSRTPDLPGAGSRLNTSYGQINSSSSSSLLSPRSAVSYDFGFLNDSPGIRLVASAEQLETKYSSDWNGAQSSMILGSLSIQRSTEEDYYPKQSIASFEEDGQSTSSLDPLNATDCIPHSHTSHPILCDQDSENNRISSHQRSHSADAVSNDIKLQELYARGSMDEGLGTIGSRTDIAGSSPESISDVHSSNHLSFKLIDDSLFTSPESTSEIARGSDDAAFQSGTIDMLDGIGESFHPLPGTPWCDANIHTEKVFDFVDRSRTDLPAISEEFENDPTVSRTILERLQNGSLNPDLSVPEPAEFAPGSDRIFQLTEEMSPTGAPIHRRVVSDNYVDYTNGDCARRSHMSNSEPPMGAAPLEIRPRNSSNRSSGYNRCKSQMILPDTDDLESSKSVNRSLSNSDPALNSEKEEEVEPPTIPSVPPPVVLTRKVSSVQHNSWLKHFPSVGGAGHNIITPTTANLPTRNIKRTDSIVDSSANCSPIRSPFTPGNGYASSFMRKSLRFLSGGGSVRKGSLSPQSNVLEVSVVHDELHTIRRRATTPHRKKSRLKARSDRSRVEKKKDKSDTFSFGNWLGGKTRGKRSKERPSLNAVIDEFENKKMSQSASFPVHRRGTHGETRPGIPSFTEDLPDNISRVFSPTDNGDDEFHYKTDVHQSLLENSKFARLDLFGELEYNTWHEKFSHEKLTRKAVKKQDAIYELIKMEREHCANIAFLQMGYRNRLLDENILTETEVNVLIPDVLDALFIFHSHLLEQLLERQNSQNEVDTISDILAIELSDEGKHTAVCVNAYTTFGSSKEKSEHTYNILKAKNAKFSEFLRKNESDKLYRKFEFKSMMTKIIGRPTKYGLLIDSIAHNEANQFSQTYEVTIKALESAKTFAMKIDHNLMIVYLSRLWEEVRVHFDTNSMTTAYVAIEKRAIRLKWTLEDICSEMKDNGRRLVGLGDVVWKVTQSGGNSKMIPVFMVLFDDILVILSKKAGKYVFAMPEQSILPCSSLILRTSGRGQSIMIASHTKPTLLEFEFLSKPDLNRWQRMLTKNISSNTTVRLSKRHEEDIARHTAVFHEAEEKKLRDAEEAWFARLKQLFDERKNQEQQLVDYFVSRRKFMDDVKRLITELPHSGRPELQDRIRETIRNKFKELRISKTVSLNKLIDDMSKARESEIWSYVNDMADLDDDDSDGSNSDSSGSGKGTKPRRIRTFNGAASTTVKEKPHLRRHTTVPRMNGAGELTDPVLEEARERKEQEIIDEKVHQLSLSQPLSSRRECRQLIKDIERLKSENISLRNELALDRIRITTLERSRGSVTPALASPVETMEALRRKEKEVREEDARRRSELDQREKEVEAKLKEFSSLKEQWDRDRLRETEELKRRECEIAEKWSILREAEVRLDSPASRSRYGVTPSRSSYEKDPKTPPVQELSPALKNLTVKSEIKKKK